MVRRVLKYLKSSINYGLHYSSYPSVLEVFANASWITNSEDHSSTREWIFTPGGGAVSWGLKKQTCIANPTMAAEFFALALACKEAEWLRNLLCKIRLWLKLISPLSS